MSHWQTVALSLINTSCVEGLKEKSPTLVKNKKTKLTQNMKSRNVKKSAKCGKISFPHLKIGHRVIKVII